MLLVNRTLAFLVPTFVPGSGPFLLLRRGARPLCDEGPGGEERASHKIIKVNTKWLEV